MSDWTFDELMTLAGVVELAIGKAILNAAGIEKVPLEYVWGPTSWVCDAWNETV